MLISQVARNIGQQVVKAAAGRACQAAGTSDSLAGAQFRDHQQEWVKRNQHGLRALSGEQNAEKPQLDPSLRQKLLRYLENPVQHAAGKENQGESLGFHSFLSDDEKALSLRAHNQLPPGVVAVVLHGRTPSQADDPKRLVDVAQRPFVGPEENWTGAELAAQVGGPQGAPVMLFCCNAGTKRFYADQFGRVQSPSGAGDMAKASGRIVIAPVNGRYNCAASGGRLERNANSTQEPFWGVFHPGGTMERL